MLLCLAALTSTAVAQSRNESMSWFRRVDSGVPLRLAQGLRYSNRYSNRYSARNKVWQSRLYGPKNRLYGFPGARPNSFYYRPWYVFPPTYWNYRPGAYRGLNPYYYRRFMYGYPPYPFDTSSFEGPVNPFLF